MHWAKGLDRRAVVVVTGLPAWEEASRDEYAAKTFVQGVTRACQLLAVVTRGGRGGATSWTSGIFHFGDSLKNIFGPN